MFTYFSVYLVKFIVTNVCLKLLSSRNSAQFNDAYAHQALFIRDIDAPSPYNEQPFHNYYG